MTSAKSTPRIKSLRRLPESNSFNDSLPTITYELPQMHRPEMLRRIRGPFETSISGMSTSSDNGRKLSKFLVNVTIERSVGPVHILISPENTVKDLIKATLDFYVKEKRRTLSQTDPQCFDLHYSQFSLESLNPKEKLINLGSRNFFLCLNRTEPVNSSCLDQARKIAANESPFPLTRLMEFLL